ncbi:MAG TPA: DUF6387 family protein [Gammaproteobacteria bacterium]|nr:DUF6387 family protein [Gammaproteobacteria bacterium]
MTETIIKSVNQLPAWYKLENYNKTNEFGESEWYDELMARFFIRYCLKYFKVVPEHIRSYWEVIKSSGLIYQQFKDEELKLRLSAYSPFIHHFVLYKEKSARKEQSRSVNSITRFTMYGSYVLNDKDNQAEINKRMRVLLNKKEGYVEDEPGEDAVAWLTQPFDDFESDIRTGLKDKFGYARVELNASDEQINQDFAAWLAEERKRRGCITSKKNFNGIDFKSWSDSAILPYLDLIFWAQMEKVKINQYVMAQAIYTDAYALGSEVDPLGKLKTTKKKAVYLMNHETMKLLEMQVNELVDGESMLTVTMETS